VDKEIEATLKHDHDCIAAMLSILPGLGHIYKGHYLSGILMILLGIPIVLWVGILLLMATAGFGVIIPLALWAMVVVNAYFEKDYRRHRFGGMI